MAPVWDHLPMPQDDAEQRIAELERQLADAKAAAHDQEIRAQPAEGAAPLSSFPPPPPQVSFSPPLARSTTQLFVNGQPVVPAQPYGSQPGGPFAGASFGPPLGRPPGPSAFQLTRGQRVLRGLGHLLWWAGIIAVGYDPESVMRRLTFTGAPQCGQARSVPSLPIRQ
jgi:hypothetical protein